MTPPGASLPALVIVLSLLGLFSYLELQAPSLVVGSSALADKKPAKNKNSALASCMNFKLGLIIALSVLVSIWALVAQAAREVSYLEISSKKHKWEKLTLKFGENDYSFGAVFCQSSVPFKEGREQNALQHGGARNGYFSSPQQVFLKQIK